jgi:hypothetical protein
MSRMKIVLGAATAVATMIAVPAVASARRPKLLTEGSGTVFKVRPARVGFTGDGTGFVAGHGSSVRHPGRIHWKWWTKRSAKGVGRVWVDDCNPSCAEGQFHPDPGWIKANRPKHGRFTHIAVHFRDQGHSYTDYRRLRHVPGDQYGPGYWEWAYASR